MSEKKGKGQNPSDENRGVEDILGGLLGPNAGGAPQGGNESEAPASGGNDLAGMLGGLMDSGAPGQDGGSGDLMGMLGGLMGGGAGGQAGGNGDLMGMLGGLLGGGQAGNSSVSSNAPSILSALLPLLLGMLGGGKRSGGVDLDSRTSSELSGMFGAAQSGNLDKSQVRSSGVVQNVAAQTGTSQDEVADTLAQLMQMLGNRS